MDRLDAARLFLRVAESRSFSATARGAGLGQPAASKQVAALEDHLGTQLIRRTSRNLTLTEAGQAFYDAALHIIEDWDEAAAASARGQREPAGLVRITAAPVFARLQITPLLPAFLMRYPDVDVELTASGRALNLVEDGIDVAIRNGPLDDSSLVARPMGSTRLVIVATPAYLAARGTPETPADLDRHDRIVFLRRGEPRPWVFASGIAHRPQGRFRTADAEQTRAAVLAGLGLAQVPGWLIAPEVASGAVHVMMRELEPPPIAISAVHPAGRRMPAKTRALVEFLAAAIAADPGTILG